MSKEDLIQLPKLITVLSQTFEIIEIDSIDFEAPVLGKITHHENTIHICRKLSTDRKKVVLLHEILHSIFEQLGFEEEHDNEHLINSLSTSIYQVLKQNPDLF